MSSELKSNLHQINLSLVKPPRPKVYEFEDFRLDTQHLMLYHGGEEISLPPKQIETLLALIEKCGEIVSKDDLMTRLWGDVAVEESNLIQNIYILRKVLGESSSGKPMIETLRRRGYRFNGDIRQDPAWISGPAAIVSDQATAKTVLKIPFSTRRRAIVAAVTVVLLTATLGAYFLFPRKRIEADGKISIAVLPLRPIDPANRDYLIEIGIPDALIQKLSSGGSLVVRQLNATSGYTEVSQDPLVAGSEQKVDYVLTSNYQIADGRIKITSQLLNVATKQLEDSYNFEKDAAGVFVLQNAVAADLGNKLIAKLGQPSNGVAGRRGTSNEEAYRLYLHGMSLIDEQTGKAIENLDRAVELDPNYALAWAGKAIAHRAAVNLNRKANTTDEYQRSMAAAEKALSIDPNISDAYSVLCENKFQYEFDSRAAEQACWRAVELDPSSPTAHRTYSFYLNSRGRHDESIAEIKTAIDLEPASFKNQRMLAIALYLARSYDKAEAQFKRVIELKDYDGATYQWLIRSLEMQGKGPEAFDWFIRSLAVQENSKRDIDRYTRVFHESGWRGVMLERLRSAGDGDLNDFRFACWNAQVGNKDKAIEHLQRGLQQRSQVMYLINVEPQLDPLRDDPRFDDLVRRVEGR